MTQEFKGVSKIKQQKEEWQKTVRVDQDREECGVEINATVKIKQVLGFETFRNYSQVSSFAAVNREPCDSEVKKP